MTRSSNTLDDKAEGLLDLELVQTALHAINRVFEGALLEPHANMVLT
jgi:hypothetical protein